MLQNCGLFANPTFEEYLHHTLSQHVSQHSTLIHFVSKINIIQKLLFKRKTTEKSFYLFISNLMVGKVLKIYLKKKGNNAICH